MPETIKQVKPVYKEYICDHCGIGTMSFGKMVYYTSPLKYEHLCSQRFMHNCPTVSFERKYPFIDYIVEGE